MSLPAPQADLPSLPGQLTAQAPVLWLTGLSGAGKSTIAQAVLWRLLAHGKRAVVLDGDGVAPGPHARPGLLRRRPRREPASHRRSGAADGRCRIDRHRGADLALLYRPRKSPRPFPARPFHRSFIDTALPVAEARDPKGLYKRARRGLLPGFTGIDAPYEVPLSPEITIDTGTTSAARAADFLIARLP